MNAGKATRSGAADQPQQERLGLIVTGIDKIADELKGKGAAFTMEPTTIRPGVRIAFLLGPQDVTIELVDRSHKGD